MAAEQRTERPSAWARNAATRTALVLGGIAFALLIGEVGARAYLARERDRDDLDVPLHVRCDCAYLYEPNREHPGIGPLGLRDRNYAIPKPAGTFRILVLGDSVAFGNGVESDETFPNVLEAALEDRSVRVEVINAGVAGYSPYNQLHYYLERGRELDPDLVVVAACLNDVVNPRLHWDISRQNLPIVPDEAIPNLEYDRTEVLPMLEALWDPERLGREHPSPLRRSRLFSLLEAALRGRTETERRIRMDSSKGVVERDGVVWPIFLTGEDTLSILVWMDYGSPEWRWLRGMYDRLAAAVRGDGAAFVIAIAPLAYQMDPRYPFLPQELLQRYCDERGVPCVDPLPRMRRHRGERVFLGELQGRPDIWHLSVRGHELFAAQLAEELDRNGLLPR